MYVCNFKIFFKKNLLLICNSKLKEVFLTKKKKKKNVNKQSMYLFFFVK